jgi:adenylate kinase
MPPENPWICDTCGGEVVQRDDDTEEAVERRLLAYERDTVPIIDYYREIGKLVRVVDGVGTGDAVFQRLTEAIDGSRTRS